MDITSSVLPVAAAALSGLVQGVGQVLRGDTSFQQLLSGEPQDSCRLPQNTVASAEDGTPEPTPLAARVQLQALRQRFEVLRFEAHEALTSRFAEFGIDLSQPAVLSVAGDGKILEASGHWDRARMEELLAADTSLRHQLQQLLDTGRQLRQLGVTGTPENVAGTPRLVVTPEELFFQVV